MSRLLLREDSICAHLSGNSKEEIFHALLGMLPDWKLTKRQRTKAIESLLLRESYGTTAVGDGLALPHTTVDGIQQPCMVLGVSRTGLDFSALDGEAVHVILLVIASSESRLWKDKCETLQEAQTLFSDPFLQRQLVQCDSPEEITGVLAREIHLPEVNAVEQGA